VSHSAEDILAHWFRSYLRNDGAKGFYVEKRHALVWLERNLNDFGLPAEKKPRRPLVAEEPAEPTEEALRERDAFLSKAATFGNGGNGARVERPRHNDNGKA
jgi:shikimate kinase